MSSPWNREGVMRRWRDGGSWNRVKMNGDCSTNCRVYNWRLRGRQTLPFYLVTKKVERRRRIFFFSLSPPSSLREALSHPKYRWKEEDFLTQLSLSLLLLFPVSYSFAALYSQQHVCIFLSCLPSSICCNTNSTIINRSIASSHLMVAILFFKITFSFLTWRHHPAATFFSFFLPTSFISFIHFHFVLSKRHTSRSEGRKEKNYKSHHPSIRT